MAVCGGQLRIQAAARLMVKTKNHVHMVAKGSALSAAAEQQPQLPAAQQSSLGSTTTLMS
jgi:hypothetical protein